MSFLNLLTTTAAPLGIRSIAFDEYTFYDVTVMGMAGLALFFATVAFIYICCCEKKAKPTADIEQANYTSREERGRHEMNRMRHPNQAFAGFDDPRRSSPPYGAPVSRNNSFGAYMNPQHSAPSGHHHNPNMQRPPVHHLAPPKQHAHAPRGFNNQPWDTGHRSGSKHRQEDKLKLTDHQL